MKNAHGVGFRSKRHLSRQASFAAYAKASLIAGAAAAPASALANFSGDYAVNPPPNNFYTDAGANGAFGTWTGTWNGISLLSSVTLDTTGAPNSIAISMPTSFASFDTYTFLVMAAASGMVSFNYVATANGSMSSSFVDVTTMTSSPLSGSSSFTASVNAGDLFGFSLSAGYLGSGMLTVSNFSGPVPSNGGGVPDQGSTLALLAAGFVGLLGFRAARARRAA